MATGCEIGSGEDAVGEGAVGKDGVGEDAFTFAGFVVLCGASGCGFEAASARSAAGALAVFEAVGGVLGDALDDAASDVVSDPGSTEVSKAVVVVSTVVGNEGVVTKVAAELVPDFASDLPAGFEFRFDELRFALELTPRLRAVLGRDLESMLASDFKTNSAPVFSSGLVPSFVPDLASVFAAVSDATG